jgi:serine/threonine protein kinase
MEYCDMGNLYTIQSKLSNKVFPIDEALNIFNQILKGVEVIHRNQIVHRDIKLENIFVKKAEKGEKGGWLCKIGDFGLARFVEMTANSNCGTQNYMAPEILRSVPYDQAVDVWSLGVLLFYLLLGDFPFKGTHGSS